MKKIFFLSFLLIPTATQCMKLISLEKKISKLNDHLWDKQSWCRRNGFFDSVSYLVMCKYPNRIYGYVEKNGVGKYYSGALCKLTSNTLAEMHALKKARYKGISAIGTVTLATEISYKEKKDIILKLLKAGYIPTKEDRRLALYLEQKMHDSYSNEISDLLYRE